MKILITGANGLLGSNLVFLYSKHNEVHATSRSKTTFKNCFNHKLDILNFEDLKIIKNIKPDLVVHCAALTNVDYCEENTREAYEINVEGTRNLINACKNLNCYFVHISTDAVFNGNLSNYSEENIPDPINVYGRTKLEAEKIVQDSGLDYCILRTNIYGWNFKDKQSLAEWILSELKENKKTPGCKDIFFPPITVTNLGRIILEIYEKNLRGIFHVGGSESCSKFEFTKSIAKIFGYDENLICPKNSDEINFKAKRAKNMILNVQKSRQLLNTKIKNIVEGIQEFKDLKDKGYVKELKESDKKLLLSLQKINKQSNCQENMEIKIGNNFLGNCRPVYFIADIAANHDGDLERAKMLIRLAKEAGANAAKFQHYDVKHCVSEKGFESLGGKFSHQSEWNKSVFQVYKDAEVPTNWTAELKKYCDEIGIDFFSTPYDLYMVDHLDEYSPAFKIGSGDINFSQMLEKVAKKLKPVLLSTGASTLGEVQKAVELVTSINKQVILLQCNTNYTAQDMNFDHINLNVLKTYRQMYPNMVLGLSDHTKGHSTVLGAVALGARVIEKHFTDDVTRLGPDHPFSMDPKTWKEMVDRTRELERSMGSSLRKVEENEKDTVILQRRCIRASRDIFQGQTLTSADLEFQRPAPKGSLEPCFENEVIGKKAKINIFNEEPLSFSNIE